MHRPPLAACAVVRLVLLLAGCGALSGCAGIVAGALTNLAVQGATVAAVGTVAAVSDSQSASGKTQCERLASAAVTITESLELMPRASDGEAWTAPDVAWRVENPHRRATAGTLAVSERAVYLLPDAGYAGWRIPMDLIESAAVTPAKSSQRAPELTITSCGGRRDLVSFAPTSGRDEAGVAADELNRRLQKLRAAKS